MTSLQRLNDFRTLLILGTALVTAAYLWSSLAISAFGFDERWSHFLHGFLLGLGITLLVAGVVRTFLRRHRSQQSAG